MSTRFGSSSDVWEGEEEGEEEGDEARGAW